MEQNANVTENSALMTTQAGYIFPKMIGDMRFVGLISIIYGALSSITILGALFGIPMIFAGVRLREAADQFFRFSQQPDPVMLQNAIEKQERFFNIIKILIIISLIFLAVYIIALVSFGGLLMSHFMDWDKLQNFPI